MLTKRRFGYAIRFSGARVNEGNTIARIFDDADVAHLADLAVCAGKKNQVAGQSIFQLYFLTYVRVAYRAARHCHVEVIEHIHYKTRAIKTLFGVSAGVFVTGAFKSLGVSQKIGCCEDRHGIAVGLDLRFCRNDSGIGKNGNGECIGGQHLRRFCNGQKRGKK